jgi:hypothetical protein
VIERDAKIVNLEGLHARPAARTARWSPAVPLETAQTFTAFYRDCRVVGAAEEGGEQDDVVLLAPRETHVPRGAVEGLEVDEHAVALGADRRDRHDDVGRIDRLVLREHDVVPLPPELEHALQLLELRAAGQPEDRAVSMAESVVDLLRHRRGK